MDELRQGLAAHTQPGQQNMACRSSKDTSLRLEAGADERRKMRWLRIDEALALAAETGEHLSDAFLHRIRGEILLKRDAANTAPAEEAFLTAIAVAQQQKAKSFELQAALALARLYQSTGRRRRRAHARSPPARRRLCADAGIPGDRRGANTSRRLLPQPTRSRTPPPSRHRRLQYWRNFIRIDQPHRRRSRHSCARARRLFADAGISRRSRRRKRRSLANACGMSSRRNC